MDTAEQKELNDELLSTSEDVKSPKRNTKEDLIRKIMMCAEDNNIELPYSDTKLRRMTKQQLCKLMAEILEQKVRNDMADQVGAKRGSGNGVIALGALKMVHNICANTAEKGINVFLPNYGYEINGFAQSLKDPVVDDAITMCLEEIARDSDVLQYVESPYTRLAIAWSGALVSSVRKCSNHKKKYATNMEPRTFSRQNPIQPRAGGRPSNGEVKRGFRPLREDVHEV